LSLQERPLCLNIDKQKFQKSSKAQIQNKKFKLLGRALKKIFHSTASQTAPASPKKQIKKQLKRVEIVHHIFACLSHTSNQERKLKK
jgi:hypothetical protein